MKLLHLSDLHIGKRVNGFSMLDDQKYILERVSEIAENVRPYGIMIAGDVFDKSVPSAEAVELLDEFLVRIAKLGIKAFIISGNHDSPERIAFGGRLMTASGIYMSPVYCGHTEPVRCRDEHGNVNVYMLPFIKPSTVRGYFGDGIVTYTDAVKAAVAEMDIDASERNVLITHQFVTGAERSESEEISVGGTDNVDACVFEGFDYVALGHVHGPQNAGGRHIRYCGAPLKYSFSEAKHKKSVTMVDLRKKGEIGVTELPLCPMRDLKEIRGKYDEILDKNFYDGTSYRDDYMHVTLTDEQDIPDAMAKLRVVYRNLMKMDYDNTRTRADVSVGEAEDVETRSLFDLFCELYEKQNNAPMSDGQKEFCRDLLDKIGEDAQ